MGEYLAKLQARLANTLLKDEESERQSRSGVYAYLHITLTARQASVTGCSRIRVLCCQALVKTLLVFLLAQRSNAQHIMRMCDRPSTATRR